MSNKVGEITSRLATVGSKLAGISSPLCQQETKITKPGFCCDSLCEISCPQGWTLGKQTSQFFRGFWWVKFLGKIEKCREKNGWLVRVWGFKIWIWKNSPMVLLKLMVQKSDKPVEVSSLIPLFTRFIPRWWLPINSIFRTKESQDLWWKCPHLTLRLAVRQREILTWQGRKSEGFDKGRGVVLQRKFQQTSRWFGFEGRVYILCINLLTNTLYITGSMSSWKSQDACVVFFGSSFFQSEKVWDGAMVNHDVPTCWKNWESNWFIHWKA